MSKIKSQRPAMTDIIYSVFSNTNYDKAFIESANELGYSKYFTNLKPLHEMTDRSLVICYNRVCSVALNMYKKSY